MRLRELYYNDEAKGGDDYQNQRAMGEGQDLPGSRFEPYNTRFKFTGTNTEEFLGKFKHAAEAMQVSEIFETDYGLLPPARGHNDYPRWKSLDSRAYRLLEKHDDSFIFSMLRDRPDMKAREIYDLLDRSFFRGTTRSGHR